MPVGDSQDSTLSGFDVPIDQLENAFNGLDVIQRQSQSNINISRGQKKIERIPHPAASR